MFNFGNSYKEHEKIRQLWSYPGSKFNAIDLIYPYLKNQKVIVSPFLGAGSLELNLAHRGHQVIGYDAFPELALLWEVCVNNNKQLYDEIESIRENVINKLNYEEFKEWYKKQWNDLFINKSFDNYPLKLAAMFYTLQQCSFSTIIRTGMPSSMFKRRMSKNIVKKILYFNSENFKFGGCKSFEQSISENPDKFLYLDPPYLLPKGNNLYGIDKSLHENFDHQKLFDLLSSRSNWLLSYNDCPQVRELYKNYKIKELKWRYIINKSKESSEILIFSN